MSWQVPGRPGAHGGAALTQAPGGGRPLRAGRHGGPVPQLRVGPGADRVADRPHAERLLRLPGPVAGAGGLAVARQPLAGPDVQRRGRVLGRAGERGGCPGFPQ